MSSRPSRPDGGWGSHLPTVPASVFRRLAIVSLVVVALIVLSGAAVRLTGSGLGCSDWPTCSTGHLTPPLQFHSLIEFGNRMVTVLLVVLVGATFLAALRRRPFRRDLVWLSGGLIVGILAEAVVGGIVVYTKLNPYLVMGHFVTTMLLLAMAVVLVHRSTRIYGPRSGRLLVPRPMLLLGRGLVALLGVVILAGSATTGAAPDAGGAQGQLVAKRIPVALRDMAELHSSLALLLVGVALSLAVALHALDVPERVRRAGRILVVLLCAQAAVGYVQYFTDLPAVVVEVHELGATVLVIGTLQLFLSLTHHRTELAVVSTATSVSAPVAGAATATGSGAATAGAEPAAVSSPLLTAPSGLAGSVPMPGEPRRGGW